MATADGAALGVTAGDPGTELEPAADGVVTLLALALALVLGLALPLGVAGDDPHAVTTNNAATAITPAG